MNPLSQPHVRPVADTDVVVAAVRAGALVVDVRTAEEVAAGTLPGAVVIDYRELSGRVDELGPDKGRTVVLFCKSGGRSGAAATFLAQSGWDDAINGGGYEELREALSLSSTDLSGCDRRPHR